MFIIQPPEDIRTIVNAQRGTYDPISQSYIGAHIPVSQPFKRNPTETDWDLVANAPGNFRPFEIHYGPLKSFLPYPCIWYEVQPAELILEIRSAMHQTGLFNLHDGHIEDFIPHMTITEGQSGPEVDDVLLDKLQKESHPGTFFCDALIHSAPDQDFLFTPRKLISLG